MSKNVTEIIGSCEKLHFRREKSPKLNENIGNLRKIV